MKLRWRKVNHLAGFAYTVEIERTFTEGVAPRASYWAPVEGALFATKTEAIAYIERSIDLVKNPEVSDVFSDE